MHVIHAWRNHAGCLKKNQAICLSTHWRYVLSNRDFKGMKRLLFFHNTWKWQLSPTGIGAWYAVCTDLGFFKIDLLWFWWGTVACSDKFKAIYKVSFPDNYMKFNPINQVVAFNCGQQSWMDQTCHDLCLTLFSPLKKCVRIYLLQFDCKFISCNVSVCIPLWSFI